jgi:hypothetical protein
MALFVRRRWPSRVAAAVVVLALVALVWWLVAGRDSSEPSAGKPAASGPGPTADPLDVKAYESELTPAADPPEGPETPAPVALAAVLAASDAELKTYADQSVSAASVPVLRRIDPSTAWVGDDPAHRVLLLLSSPEHPFAFEAGARLTFTGAARRAGAGFGRQLGLTGEELADFDRQGTYVEVEQYTEA